jgi:hypothetical protein
MSDLESPTTFYLGREYDLSARRALPERPVQYSSRDLTTHAVVLGMTGSGKTGLCIDILEEAALDGVPAIVVDPKGDIANLLLQFPDLRAEDFLPWVDPSAAQADVPPEQLAAAEAERWRAGLAEWGMDPERIRALDGKVDFAVYTPGSDAGLSVSVLQSLRAPSPEDWDHDAEGVRARISGTVSALLGLLSIDADPVRSREHILLSNLFEYAWRRNRDLDLAQLILQINQPPFAKLGAFDVDTFFPEKDRFALATTLNGLIAAPAFQSWIEGEPLDVGGLLRSPSGKPRISLFYIAHLSEPERMFFVTLLVEQIQAWMHQQTGTINLRALFYLDEVYGYFPPYPSNPPSKAPLLRLLKEARAFGVGLMLVTQNPMDLDYKSLTNAGTWFIGKLQTDRDKARVLDGLEGASTAAQQGIGRDDLDRLISALDTRVFVMHNVHAQGPRVFQTRWALSYLRGPLTRAQLRKLGVRRVPGTAETAGETSFAVDGAPAVQAAPARSQAARATTASAEALTLPPALPSEVRQYYLPITDAPDLAVRRWGEAQGRALPPDAAQSARLHYVPGLLAQGLVRFFDRKAVINEEQAAACLVRVIDARGLVRWEDNQLAPLDATTLGQAPFSSQATFAQLPAPLANPRKLAALEKDFVSFLYRSIALSLWYNPVLKSYSTPGQTERDFRMSCEEAVRAARAADASRVQARSQTRLDALRTKLAAEERKRAALDAETQDRETEQTWTNLETVWDALTRRRIRRPLSTGKRAERMADQSRLDLEASEARVTELRQQIAELEARANDELQGLSDKWVQALQQIQPLQIAPKKSDIRVELFGVGWVPVWQVRAGAETVWLPAFGQS